MMTNGSANNVNETMTLVALVLGAVIAIGGNALVDRFAHNAEFEEIDHARIRLERQGLYEEELAAFCRLTTEERHLVMDLRTVADLTTAEAMHIYERQKETGGLSVDDVKATVATI